MPLSQIQIGPPGAAIQPSSTPTARGGPLGDTIVSELHGKFYEQARLGNVFSAIQAAAGVILNTLGTAASFALANPAGSGKNLAIVRLEAAIKALPGTPVIGFYGVYVNNNPVAAVVTGTALTPIPALVGSNYQPVGKPFSSATLPAAPTLYRLFQQKTATAEAPLSPPNVFSLEFDGAFILAPGATLSIQQDVADTTNATFVCAALWEEVPV